MPTNNDLPSVITRRRYRASSKTVFRMFTVAEELERWFSPGADIGTEVEALDLREGGTYRLGFRFPDGHRNHVLGEYREIRPPTRLVFTWTWEEPDPHAGIETLVTVELLEQGTVTQATVTHARLPDRETRERHEEGWAGALDRLGEHLVAALGRSSIQVERRTG